MTILLSILAAVVAYQAFKRMSPAGMAIAVVIGLCSYQSLFSPFMETIELVFINNLGNLIIICAIAYSAAYLFFKKVYLKFQAGAQESWVSDMRVVVGRVLDTKTNTTVYSSVNIGRDSLGGVSGYTSHDVEVTHNTWLLDLNTGREVNYSGGGEMRARPGHVLGTMSWKGRNLIDRNFNTGQVFYPQKTSTNIFVSMLWSAMLVLFGVILFPVLCFMAPMVWLGWFAWNGNAGVFVNNVAPGFHKIEAGLIYGGGLIYLVAWAIVMWRGNDTLGLIPPVAFILFVLYVSAHQYVARTVVKRYETLIELGKAEIDRQYQLAEEKHRAAAASAASAESTAPVQILA